MNCKEYLEYVVRLWKHTVAEFNRGAANALEANNELHGTIQRDLNDAEKRTCLLSTSNKVVLEMFDTIYTIPQKEELFGSNWRRKLNP